MISFIRWAGWKFCLWDCVMVANHDNSLIKARIVRETKKGLCVRDLFCLGPHDVAYLLPDSTTSPKHMTAKQWRPYDGAGSIRRWRTPKIRLADPDKFHTLQLAYIVNLSKRVDKAVAAAHDNRLTLDPCDDLDWHTWSRI